MEPFFRWTERSSRRTFGIEKGDTRFEWGKSSYWRGGGESSVSGMVRWEEDAEVRSASEGGGGRMSIVKPEHDRTMGVSTVDPAEILL